MTKLSSQLTIAALCIYGKSIALWNCIKQHLDLMALTGANIVILVPSEEPIDFIQEEYESKVVLFSNKRELIQIVKNKDVDVLWYPSILSMCKYGNLKKHCRKLLWIQGSVADESYLRNNSVIRKGLLNLLELYALNESDGLIYVSDSMRCFYEKKYKHRFDNFAIVPCISDFHNYEPHLERIPESFVYIGGLSEWQCFEDIVDIYSVVRTNKSVFHIITMDTENATKIVKRKMSDTTGICIYSLTDREQIPDVLSTFQYGFLIRKESPVNYVSSPIKFLEYLSCGVNVIMTEAIPSYAKLVRENKVGTIVDLNNKNEIHINAFSSNARDVYKTYFKKEQLVDQYQRLIKHL